MAEHHEFARMLDYLAALEAHNDRDWFHENHRWYEGAKGDFVELLERARFALADAAPALAADLMSLPAKSWMYRVAKDARIYHDCPPYTPSFRAYLSADRKSWLPIGYFLCIQPGERSLFGTGLWCEEREQLARVRGFLLTEYERLEEILAAQGLTLEGRQLKTMPRGYDAAHPAARWLRYTNMLVSVPLPDASLTDFDALAEALGALARRMEPLRAFLLEAATAA